MTCVPEMALDSVPCQVDKLRSKVPSRKTMPVRFKTVLSASGNVPDAIFLKASQMLDLPIESYRIGYDVLVMGYRQATVARHVAVSRQRVHTICAGLLESINQLMSGTTIR